MKVICELREKYSLSLLLKIAGISKSTYSYSKNHLDYKAQKDEPLLDEIRRIFKENGCKYGYPRITLELKRRGYKVNEKRVARIMRENGIRAAKRKRRYNSYKGTVGKIAPNILERDFKTTGPYQKIGTDVTVFITQHGKLYLSPVIDFHTREILAYDLSEHPNLKQIRRMLDRLVEGHGEHLKGAIMHSDQGWQYQMLYYRKFLKEHEIIQSMSRKGNCLDNSPTENFFARLKTEMYYDKEYSFKSIADLRNQIKRYIDYYNEERIVSRIGCSPRECRETFFETVI